MAELPEERVAMANVASRPLSVFAQLSHWGGCLLGTAVVLLFTVSAIGQGLPPLAAMNASFAAVAVMLVGFLLMWWKDWLGGVVSLIGLGWFQALEIAVNGQPSQGVFSLFVIPGLLAIVAGLIRRFAASTVPA
jgi:hypothetical protein